MITIYSVEKNHPKYGWSKVTGDQTLRERAEREMHDKIKANQTDPSSYRISVRVV